ncbi:MAG: indole-3-glycerol phosphate synthase TrpC [Deltaproteobacteria bacterium]|nr:indole-3-glycerol phosphate synthase TrpC [Deltaproteobacteria bacterium]
MLRIRKTYLDDIIIYKKQELEERKKKIPYDILKMQLQFVKKPKDFKEALTGDGVKIIAEIKKASPSKGVIRENFDHIEIAEAYEKAGAAAISVLTDSKFFQGDIEYLSQARQVVDIPLLRKDFIIDEYQVVEARIYGADAVLLIATVLPEDELKYLYELSRSLGMHVLVEVHDKKDLKKALNAGADIIGINNRDLKKFKTDIQTTVELAKIIPNDRIIVSESGINSIDDIKMLREGGADAFLIGEAFMREVDPEVKLREFMGE